MKLLEETGYFFLGAALMVAAVAIALKRAVIGEEKFVPGKGDPYDEERKNP